ncbi:MAG: thymidylate synthase [Brevirhabdus sp.]
MKRIFIIASACAAGFALASCGGSGSNPVTGGGSGTGGGTGTGGTTTTVEDNAIPAALAGNLTRISYDAATDALTVEIKSLDDPISFATYTRNAALDVPGYSAFSVQDDALDRMFVALANASTDGSVQAAVVLDGGQFNRYFSGGYYERTGDASLPTSGLVSYSGSYGGISNLQHPDPNAAGTLPVPAGTPSEVTPGTPRLTQGDIFINADFADNTINGTIYNRSFADDPTETLESLALVVTDIDGNGEFLGSAEFLGQPGEGSQGSYGGIIGGTDASSIAGVVSLTNIFLSSDARDTEFDAEVGVFVLDGCHTATPGPVCP